MAMPGDPSKRSSTICLTSRCRQRRASGEGSLSGTGWGRIPVLHPAVLGSMTASSSPTCRQPRALNARALELVDTFSGP